MGSAARRPHTAQHPLQDAAMLASHSAHPRQFIAALAALPAWGCPRRQQAPALLLAQTAPAGIDPTGFLVSEKYDGVRALWDGQRAAFSQRLDDCGAAQASSNAAGRAVGRRTVARPRPLRGAVGPGAPAVAGCGGLAGAALHGVRSARRERALCRRARSASQRSARHTGWPQLQAVEQSVLTSPQALQRWLDEVVAAGGEGLMLHRADAAYVAGRSARC